MTAWPSSPKSKSNGRLNCLSRRQPLSAASRRFVKAATLQVFQPQLNELGRLHQQWLSDLYSFKNSLRAQGAEPKALEYVNEAFRLLAERINKLAG